MDNMTLKSKIISENYSTVDFLKRVQDKKNKLFFVTDGTNKFIGVITEGDFRRFVINNAIVPETIKKIVNRSAKFILEDELKSLYNSVIDLSKGEVPVLNAHGEIIDFYPSSSPTVLNKNVKYKVVAIAPTRISFAGGGSDVNYWFEKQRGAVVNLAIGKYARVAAVRNFSDYIKIYSLNTGETLELKISDLKSYNDEKLCLVVKCLQRCLLSEGIDLEIFCDFGPGTGLGGSSSLTVAIIKALSELFYFQITNQQLTDICYDIERNDAGISGGWQDQIAAVNGGLCVTNFRLNNIEVHKISLSQKFEDYLNSSLFLSKIGTTRKSDTIHRDQKNVSNDLSYRPKMQAIVELADKSSALIGDERIDELGKILHEGWLLKRSLGDFISNPEIDNRYEILLSFGAQGGRLVGAGGSGFILIVVDPIKQASFMKMCETNSIPIERIKIDTLGARTL